MASRSKPNSEGIAGYSKEIGAAHWRQIKLSVIQTIAKML